MKSFHMKQQINFKYYIGVKYAPLKEENQFQVKHVLNKYKYVLLIYTGQSPKQKEIWPEF